MHVAFEVGVLDVYLGELRKDDWEGYTFKKNPLSLLSFAFSLNREPQQGFLTAAPPRKKWLNSPWHDMQRLGEQRMSKKDVCVAN